MSENVTIDNTKTQTAINSAGYHGAHRLIKYFVCEEQLFVSLSSNDVVTLNVFVEDHWTVRLIACLL